MRKILTLATVLALAGCGGGGGGGSTSPQPPQAPQQTSAPQAGMVTPQFTIVVPSGKSKSSVGRKPNYVSSGTLSVQITLTADSNGVTPNTIAGNPATTSIPAGTCNSGCTVNGPPSPPGTDSFLIVTYDNAVPASGHPLNAGQINNVTITAGQNNPESVTLGAIPHSLSISGVPTTFNAGTASQHATITVVATDAAGVTIPTGATPNVVYVDATGAAINVTVSDPDTGQHGSCVIPTGTSTCTTGAATSVTFAGPDATNVLAYDGLAENPVTLTPSATPATGTITTASFQPNLNAPVFNGAQATPSPAVAQSGSAEIDLFATSGIGSTGTESFTESGWTNSPYGHALTFANTGSCTSGAGLAATMADIATISVGTNSTTNGTPITATTNTGVGQPKPGSCPSTISDGLSSNTTDGSATLTVTYTTSSISASSKHRHQ